MLQVMLAQRFEYASKQQPYQDSCTSFMQYLRCLIPVAANIGIQDKSISDLLNCSIPRPICWTTESPKF